MSKSSGAKKKGADSVKAASSSTSDDAASSAGHVVRTTFVLPFPSIPLMSLHLSRFSAYVEDPCFKGTPMTYSGLLQNNCPAHRYAGHNFTLTAFQAAVQALGGESKLSKEEKRVQMAITEGVKNLKTQASSQGHKQVTLDVYIIAHVASDERTYNHEKCHAIFHYTDEYAKRVGGIWSTVQKSNPSWAGQFVQHLGKMYHTDVHLDEFQAIIINREYEMTQKTVNLLQAALPADKSLNFNFVTINIPIDKSSIEDAEMKAKEYADIHGAPSSVPPVTAPTTGAGAASATSP